MFLCVYVYAVHMFTHVQTLSHTHTNIHTHTYTYDGDATVISWSLVKALIKERANVVLPAPTSPLSRITSPSCATSAMDLYGCVEESAYVRVHVHVHVHVHMHVHVHVHVHACVCVRWIVDNLHNMHAENSAHLASSSVSCRPSTLHSTNPPHPPADTTPPTSLRRQGGGCGLECTTLLRPALQRLLYASARW